MKTVDTLFFSFCTCFCVICDVCLDGLFQGAACDCGKYQRVNIFFNSFFLCRHISFQSCSLSGQRKTCFIRNNYHTFLLITHYIWHYGSVQELPCPSACVHGKSQGRESGSKMPTQNRAGIIDNYTDYYIDLLKQYNRRSWRVGKLQKCHAKEAGRTDSYSGLNSEPCLKFLIGCKRRGSPVKTSGYSKCDVWSHKEKEGTE